MIALPLIWGQGLAFALLGYFSWQWFVIAQTFGLFIQIHALYLNDYADEALDRQNKDYWLSGGSRVIPEGVLTGAQLLRASHWVTVALLLLAAVCLATERSWMVVFVLLALLSSWSYSLPPVRASYNGIGELHQGLSCGIGLPLCAWYLQVGSLATFPWLLLLPLVLIFAASNIVTALPDMASDATGGKRSYPARFGEPKARSHAALLSLVASSLVFLFVRNSTSGLESAIIIALPAMLLFAYLAACDKLPEEVVLPRKRYILLTMVGHLWIMLGWIAVLFTL